MVVGKAKLLKVNQIEKAAVGVDATIETTAAHVKADHMAGIFVTFNTIPQATIAARPASCPGSNLRISGRIIGSRLVNGKTCLKLQQG